MAGCKEIVQLPIGQPIFLVAKNDNDFQKTRILWRREAGRDGAKRIESREPRIERTLSAELRFHLLFT
jgi:hypothetical protein